MKSVIKSEKQGASVFMSGVLVLSLSTVIVKIIGLAYKIPMLSYLGVEGMGYFNSAYEIYALLCVISTAGLPVALSMLVSAGREAGRTGQIQNIYRTSLKIFLFLGISGSALMLVLAKQISGFIGNADAYYCIVAISPALICVCISSAVRGYFQGYSCMYPTALSQLIEALGKLVLGVLFASMAIKRGYGVPVCAAFAVVGLSVGTFLSALYLVILKSVKGKKGEYVCPPQVKGEKKEKILGTLMKIALPITLSSAVLSVTRIVDMALIMRRLQSIGYTAGAANSVYGSYTTLAVPVFGLIPSLITPVSLALVPSLSASIESGNTFGQSATATNSMRLTVLLAMPSSIGISLYSGQIINLLFRDAGGAAEYTAPLLSVLGISVLFACIITTTNAILQSYRRTVIPIVSMAVGAAVKTVSAYLLIGIPSVNIFGAPISTLFCNITVTAINVYFVYRCVPECGSVGKIFVRPFAASVPSVALSYVVYFLTMQTGAAQNIAFITAVAVAVILYIPFAFAFKALSMSDLALVPGGNRLCAFLSKNKEKS